MTLQRCQGGAPLPPHRAALPGLRPALLASADPGGAGDARLVPRSTEPPRRACLAVLPMSTPGVLAALPSLPAETEAAVPRRRREASS